MITTAQLKDRSKPPTFYVLEYVLSDGKTRFNYLAVSERYTYFCDCDPDVSDLDEDTKWLVGSTDLKTHLERIEENYGYYNLHDYEDWHSAAAIAGVYQEICNDVNQNFNKAGNTAPFEIAKVATKENFRAALKEINSNLWNGYSIEATQTKVVGSTLYGYLFCAFHADGSSTGYYGTLFDLLSYVYVWGWFDNTCLDALERLKVLAKSIEYPGND